MDEDLALREAKWVLGERGQHSLGHSAHLAVACPADARCGWRVAVRSAMAPIKRDAGRVTVAS
jgi:hypothetical protein